MEEATLAGEGAAIVVVGAAGAETTAQQAPLAQIAIARSLFH